MFRNRAASVFIGILIGLAAVVRAEDPADTLVQIKPLSISTKFDMGQIVQGYNTEGDDDFEGQFLQRLGVWFTQETTVGSRLSMKMGVGGVFWYAIPPFAGAPHTLLTKFGPGISQAQALYRFGNPAKPSAELQMGFFPYKYNPEASNLGEYLLRSGTYPGYLTTGGWNIINSAYYMVQGLRLGFPLFDGKLRNDFILPMEKDIPPMYDFSPTYVGTYTLSPAFQFGAGITFARYIPIHPSQESPRTISPSVLPYDTVRSNASRASLNDWILKAGDPRCGGDILGDGKYCADSADQYTLQGIKLMARVTFDPKPFFASSGLFAKEDLKLSVEAALLGVKNYPYYYENRLDRMPVTVGFNVPTFKILDLLSVQMEYTHSQFPNDINLLYQNQLPVWTLKNNDPNANDSAQGRINSGRINWSILARRAVVKGINLYAQVANDHLRTFDYNVQLSGQPVTTRMKDWYYLLRLEFGI
jgi:hypothetical protein